MSSLGYFWTHGFEGQSDIFEGVCEAHDPAISQIGKTIVVDADLALDLLRVKKLKSNRRKK